jgi:hypothetical protein
MVTLRHKRACQFVFSIDPASVEDRDRCNQASTTSLARHLRTEGRDNPLNKQNPIVVGQFVDPEVLEGAIV